MKAKRRQDWDDEVSEQSKVDQAVYVKRLETVETLHKEQDFDEVEDEWNGFNKTNQRTYF